MNSSFLLMLVASSLAHPGGLDANGGHHDRRRGGYHYHARASAPVVVFPPASVDSFGGREDSFRREARTAARMKARTSVRTTAWTADEKKPVVTEMKASDFKRELRTWTDLSGRFSVVARFAGYVPARVRLIKEDEAEIHVDIEILSASDKAYLRNILAKSGMTLSF